MNAGTVTMLSDCVPVAGKVLFASLASAITFVGSTSATIERPG